MYTVGAGNQQQLLDVAYKPQRVKGNVRFLKKRVEIGTNVYLQNHQQQPLPRTVEFNTIVTVTVSDHQQQVIIMRKCFLMPSAVHLHLPRQSSHGERVLRAVATRQTRPARAAAISECRHVAGTEAIFA